MANKILKICGVVAAIFEMETNERDGEKYYSQVISLKYEDGGRDKYANMTLRGDKINKFASVVSESYKKKTLVTASIDVAGNRASKYNKVDVWRIQEGDTVDEDTRAVKAVDPNEPIIGIPATENGSPIPSNVSEQYPEVNNLPF